MYIVYVTLPPGISPIAVGINNNNNNNNIRRGGYWCSSSGHMKLPYVQLFLQPLSFN
jgi:hypothetical protein